MICSKIIIPMIAIMSFNQLEAQVNGRERNTNNLTATRDSALYKKKLIETKYDSLINLCNSQIVVLGFEIAGLQKQIENLKTKITQSEQEHQIWLKNTSRTLKPEQTQIQSQQKQKELEKKISDLNKQIYVTKNIITTNEAEIKKLKANVTQLEKQKAETLKKN